eukprot:scaffold5828_cov168-Amphora_coffeaeformis.AAC.12
MIRISVRRNNGPQKTSWELLYDRKNDHGTDFAKKNPVDVVRLLLCLLCGNKPHFALAVQVLCSKKENSQGE